MEHIVPVCDRVFALTPIPLLLVDGEGHIRQSWPEALKGCIRSELVSLVLEDFRLQKRDARHPLISFLHNGFFVGAAALEPGLYLIIGLASPYRHSRKELTELFADAVMPAQLQLFCDLTLQAPLVTLPQMRAYVGLVAQLLSGAHIPDEQILFSDSASHVPFSTKHFADAQFRQREEADEHAALDYETSVCQAVTLGRPDLLARALIAPTGGSVGTMSANALRQIRYAFISFATLVSRAAIRGGLPEETAFLLSDLYCQRMDALSERADIERLLVGMAMDFCDKVAKNRQPQELSPLIRRALSYISLHLHDSFGMEELAAHCGLGRRSLSLRFREEMGMSVVEYVQREKIGEARFLLEHTALSLPQIAAYLNYSSQSYFTEQFRKLLGETPERYRNSRRRR